MEALLLGLLLGATSKSHKCTHASADHSAGHCQY
jgi:hypothetical protein